MTLTRHPTGQDLMCLVCLKPAQDIHHVQVKGMGGSKERDIPENKIALCRPCHDARHQGVLQIEAAVSNGWGSVGWKRREGDVWINVPVEVSKRYKCLVLSDGAEAGERTPDSVITSDTVYVEADPSAPSPSAGQSKEESDGRNADAGRNQASPGRRGEDATTKSSADATVLDTSHFAAGGAEHRPTALTHEQRVAIAQAIKDTEWNRQWHAGDTGNQWIAELGESAEQYLSDFGYVHESLANILYVCEAIPKDVRRPGLRFSHHVVMLGLNREDMEMWLTACEEYQWSVAEFRRQVKGTKPRVKRWSRPELQERWDGFWAVREQENPGWDFGNLRHIAFAKFLDWLSAEEQVKS